MTETRSRPRCFLRPQTGAVVVWRHVMRWLFPGVVVVLCVSVQGCLLLAGKDACARSQDCWYGRVCGWDGRCHEPQDVPAVGTTTSSGGSSTNGASTSGRSGASSSSVSLTSSSSSSAAGGSSAAATSSSGPSCETEERVLVLTEDAAVPIQVLRASGATLLPVEPQGGGSRVLTLQGGEAVPTPTGFALAGNRIFVACGSHLVAVDATTLTQVPLYGATLSLAVGSMYGLVATERYLVAGGADLWRLDLQNLSLAPVVMIQDDLHRVIKGPGPNGSTIIVANLEGGYAVFQAAPGAVPALIQRVSDSTRFGSFGGGISPRALALDPLTGLVVLGNVSGVTLLRPGDGYAAPAMDEPTRMYPAYATLENGIGLVGGQGWGEIRKMDFTQSPAVLLDQVPVTGVDFSPRAAALGCRRLVLANAFTGSGLVSFDKDTLSPLGVAVGGTRGTAVMVVQRNELNLAGDVP